MDKQAAKEVIKKFEKEGGEETEAREALEEENDKEGSL